MAAPKLSDDLDRLLQSTAAEHSLSKAVLVGTSKAPGGILGQTHVSIRLEEDKKTTAKAPVPPVASAPPRSIADDAESERIPIISDGELRRRLKQLADSNDPVAQYIFAVTYLHEVSGVAMALLTNSARAGCPAAATLMSTQFEEDVDVAERLYWLRKAASGGDASAQLLLSLAYSSGTKGVRLSNASAYAWLSLAERQTYSKTQKTIIDTLKVTMLVNLEEKENEEAHHMIKGLMELVPVIPEHPCGQADLGISFSNAVVPVMASSSQEKAAPEVLDQAWDDLRRLVAAPLPNSTAAANQPSLHASKSGDPHLQAAQTRDKPARQPDIVVAAAEAESTPKSEPKISATSAKAPKSDKPSRTEAQGPTEIPPLPELEKTPSVPPLPKLPKMPEATPDRAEKARPTSAIEVPSVDTAPETINTQVHTPIRGEEAENYVARRLLALAASVERSRPMEDNTDQVEEVSALNKAPARVEPAQRQEKRPEPVEIVDSVVEPALPIVALKEKPDQSEPVAVTVAKARATPSAPVAQAKVATKTPTPVERPKVKLERPEPVTGARVVEAPLVIGDAPEPKPDPAKPVAKATPATKTPTPAERPQANEKAAAPIELLTTTAKPAAPMMVAKARLETPARAAREPPSPEKLAPSVVAKVVVEEPAPQKKQLPATLFDRFPAATSVDQLKRMIADSAQNRAVMLVVLPLEDKTSAEIEDWVIHHAGLHDAFNAVQVIIANTSEDAAILRSLDLSATPSFVGYTRLNKDMPMLKRIGQFGSPDHLKSWLTKLSMVN